MSGKIYTHPGQPQMQVEVILASRSTVEQAPPIYAIRMRYPRPIHGEIMTHRKFGRNARSSRAVPVLTMLNEVRTIPYVPWHWGANQKGMQASEECNELLNPTPMFKGAVFDPYELPHDTTREQAWLHARNHAVASAEAFMNAGYHKQNANRLLEPFSWMDCLITSTDWNNFLWLRDHKDAEPHLQDLARLVKQAMSDPDQEIQILQPGQWHLPYITEDDRLQVEMYHNYDHDDEPVNDHLRKISAARCARISYKPFDGDGSLLKEFERYNSLVTSDRVHASPLEHQATPDVRKKVWICDKPHIWQPKEHEVWAQARLAGNLDPGWIQARKLVPSECYKGTV